MKNLLPALVTSVLVCGCASTKVAKTKPILQRPWIGGHFDDVPVPASIRTNGSSLGKHGALLTVLHKGTPLEKAGLREGDLVLAINGANVRYESQIRSAIEKNGNSAAQFTVYRDGIMLERTVIPGEERFHEVHSLGVRIGLSTHLDFDLWPNPDFSLVAIGYRQKRDRIELRDVKSKYLQALASSRTPEQKTPQPLDSEEGWEFWVGPFFATQHKTILSQE